MKGKGQLVKKIKIAFLMQESRMGGIEYNSLHLAEKVNPEKFEIIFLCPGEDKLPSLLREKKIPFLFYQRPPFFSTSFRVGKRYVFNPLATLYNFLCFFVIALKLSGLLKQEQFSLVYTKGILANFYGSLAARLAGIPSIWDMQEVVPAEKAFGLFSGVLNLWSNFVGRITVSSEAMRDQFPDRIKGKISVIPNGIDIEKFHPGINPEKIRREWKIKPGEILIAHIARFTYWKGQKDFLEAAGKIAAEIRDAKFAVVGSPVFENDQYEQELKILAKKNNLEGRILFPGFRDDLMDVLAATDIFVHSSTEPEGCPITLITAMAMAKPVVLTEVKGNTEIVCSSDQAILVPLGRPDEIAAAVIKIIKNKELGRSLGIQARKRASERHSLENYAKNCEGVFEKLAG